MTNVMKFVQHLQVSYILKIHLTGRAPQHASLEHDILTVRNKFNVLFSEFMERINSPLTTFFFPGGGGRQRWEVS